MFCLPTNIIQIAMFDTDVGSDPFILWNKKWEKCVKGIYLVRMISKIHRIIWYNLYNQPSLSNQGEHFCKMKYLLFYYFHTEIIAMSSIVIGSLNCKGLIADSVKICDIFTKYKDWYEVTVLVDIHGIVEHEKKWLHEWGYIAKFSSFSSNSMGGGGGGVEFS
jgi:hypothetical protein